MNDAETPDPESDKEETRSKRIRCKEPQTYKTLLP